MRVLTIHNHNNGAPGDFCWGIEGEIAVPAPVVCDRRDCGCDRSHGGLNSHRAATTLMVRDLELDFDDLVAACTAFLEDAGWTDASADVAALAAGMITAGAEAAAPYPAGTVLRPPFDHDTQEWHYVEAQP